MRQPQNQRRGRGRGGRKPSGRNQTFDSNGPQGRIRGNAQQVHEKYLNQARDAASGGDRILSENLFQHADHYYRIMLATGIVQPQSERRDDQSDDQPHDDQQQPQQQHGRGKRRKPNGKADQDHDGDGQDDGEQAKGGDGQDGAGEQPRSGQGDGGKPRRGRPRKKQQEGEAADHDDQGRQEAANADAS